MSMLRFDGKVIIVTGGSLGIGQAAANLFAKQGGSLVIASREAAAGAAAVDAIVKAGGRAIHVAADVSKEADVQKLVAATLDKLGRIDVLVNNAGMHRTGDAKATSLADWERMMAVNVTSAFLCTKHAADALAATRGVIVNVSSEAGLVGIGNQVAYNVSKAAMIELTKSCALDFAPLGVRVNCVCPGTTATPLVAALFAKSPDPVAARRQWESIRPMNRLGTPEEVASAILYMASAEAGYATGAVLAVDGGYTAQ
jgi:NAD(P)-dependent dehydrogenase (short-subunit alcohol dehydrogenase family)